MYPDVKTWNGMYGICPHNCLYCYNRIHWSKWGKMRLNEKALKDNLGSSNYYFVGSSCDMFANSIPKDWILKVLGYCRKFDNKYLFQTKNPKRFEEFIDYYPNDTILGTTIETNRNHILINNKSFSRAPPPLIRGEILSKLKFKKMVSLEPIMDFDEYHLVECIRKINPEYVSIGADSKGHNLPEPPPNKINSLIKELKEITEVKIKDNLKRLMEVENESE